MAAVTMLMLLTALSCNSQNGSGSENHRQVFQQASTPTAGEKQCYNLMEAGDTIVISLNWQDSGKFTGSMRYQLREKDRNIGTLKGRLRDSVLLADYQFNSEGMNSRREVAFKMISDYLVEGFGDVTPDSSGFRFTEPLTLRYDLNRKIHRVNCL